MVCVDLMVVASGITTQNPWSTGNFTVTMTRLPEKYVLHPDSVKPWEITGTS